MATRIEVPLTVREIDAVTPEDRAVSWAAIFAGAVVAIAIALILLELGLGVGLAAAMPWRYGGPSATSFGIGAGIWLIVVEWIAAGIGGYVAGRLRTKWVGIHTDEVFFRDTAHGLLSWALATVAATILVVVGGLASIGGTAATAASGGAQASGSPSSYFADLLFRSPTPPSGAAVPTPPGTTTVPGPDPRPEAAMILTRDVASGGPTPDDRAYLGQLVAARTGMSQADAEKRVDGVVSRLEAAANSARKAAASAAIIMALALLVGAFIASTAGAIGGHRRDSF